MKKYTLLIFTLLCVGYGKAQHGKLQVVQPPAIERLIERHIAYNSTHPIEGYRVRIYRDNATNARQRSQDVRERFVHLYPGTSTYLTYDNPYFKVAVGDFRTKDEAFILLNKIKTAFPKAFIIAESIRLPPLRPRNHDENYSEQE